MTLNLSEQYLEDSSEYLSGSSFDSLALFEQYEPFARSPMATPEDDACDNLYPFPG